MCALDCIASCCERVKDEIEDAMEEAERETGPPEPTPHEQLVDFVYDSIEVGVAALLYDHSLKSGGGAPAASLSPMSFSPSLFPPPHARTHTLSLSRARVHTRYSLSSHGYLCLPRFDSSP